MELKEMPDSKLQKIPHNRCITLRVTAATLAEWLDESKKDPKTLSGRLNVKIRSAFQILFSAVRKGEIENARN